MSLTNLIQSIPDWQNKTPEQLHAVLSDSSILVTDNRLYTWAGVALIAGDAGASAMCSRLIEFGKLWAVHQLGGAGLDLSNDEIQQQLYLLDSLGVPGMTALAQHVRHYISPLQQAGIEATLDDVALAQRRAILEDAAVDRLQLYREALASWDGVAEEPVL